MVDLSSLHFTGYDEAASAEQKSQPPHRSPDTSQLNATTRYAAFILERFEMLVADSRSRALSVLVDPTTVPISTVAVHRQRTPGLGLRWGEHPI